MKGGVKLTRKGTLVDGVLHMIEHGTLSLVTNESYYGSIFRIDCQNTPFSGMDNQPVTTICLKLCILDDHDTVRIIGGNEKCSVSIDAFVHEVKLQQDIFLAVSTTSDEKVCPGIITAMIDEQIPTPPLQPTYFQRMLHYLGIQSIPIIDKTLLQKLSTMQGTLVQELMQTQLPIGIIAMEMISDSVPLNRSPSQTYEPYVSAIAKLVRIFFRTDERGVVGTVHCDCHRGNILASEDSAIIIDFGRTVDRYTPFTEEQQATFQEKWGEPLRTVYDRCCAFDEIVFHSRIRGKDNSPEQLAELLNFFIFMDSLKNQNMGRPVIQMNGLLKPFVTEDNVKVFEMQEFPLHLIRDILAECRRRRRIVRPHPYEVLRTLQEEGRLFDGNPTKKLRGEPLLESLPEPDRQRDEVFEPMTDADKDALFTQLTEVYELTDEKAHEIVEISNQYTGSIYDLVVEALQDPSNRRGRRGGKNKRIKHVSKRSTASRRHATRRHSSKR
jgi:hypothetical protein